MPFDPIMGVGRTPKITEDIQTNPFGVSVYNILEGAYISDVTTALAATVNEENLEYSVNEDVGPDAVALNVSFTGASGTGSLVNWNYDIRKVVYLDKVTAILKGLQVGSFTKNFSVTFSYSQDGVNYTTYQTDTFTTGTDVKRTLEYRKIKARFLKIQVNNGSPVSGADWTLTFYKMSAYPDSLQY